MRGHPKVIEYLKLLLRGQLAARDQYFIHSRRCESMGLRSLYERIDHEMQSKTRNADVILRRILALDGDPDLRPQDFAAGHTIETMLQNDLKVECRMRAALANGIYLNEHVGDVVTSEILRVQLQQIGDDHAHWLLQQLRLIHGLGISHYLTARLTQKQAGR